MLLSFTFPLWVIWTFVAVRACSTRRMHGKMTKDSALSDYGRVFFQSVLISLPAAWLIIEIQSYLIVTGFFLLLAILVNLLIGGGLTFYWLNIETTLKRYGEVERAGFVRKSILPFPFLAAGLFWLSAWLFPGVFTPVDAYVLKYSTLGIIGNTFVAIVIVVAIVSLCAWSLDL